MLLVLYALLYWDQARSSPGVYLIKDSRKVSEAYWRIRNQIDLEAFNSNS